MPGGKQILGANHIVYTNSASLGTMSHSYQLGHGGNLPEIQIPSGQSRASLVDSL